MRRLRLRASSLSPGSSGWNSPKPAATSRFAGTPFSIRNFTTEVARADDKLPIVAIAAGAGKRPVVGVAVDAQHPVDLRRNFLLQLDQRLRQLRHLGAAGIVDVRRTDRKQHLGLEDEAVADDADVFAVGKDFAQPPEEIGAVAVEFLDTLGQRDVETPAEIGDLGVGLAVARFRDVQRVLQRADLLAQGRDLLVEQFDLAQRLLADLPLANPVRRRACRCAARPRRPRRRPCREAAAGASAPTPPRPATRCRFTS